MPLLLRRMLLGLLLLEMIGTEIELLFLKHFEDAWQVVPIGLIALALIVLIWNVATQTAASIQAFRVMMVLAFASGFIGLALHYQGAAEFQLDIDRTMHGPALWLKALQAKAPPALAPAVMSHFGLLGLVYTYRHPSLERTP
jgi:hypothetical protein